MYYELKVNKQTRLRKLRCKTVPSRIWRGKPRRELSLEDFVEEFNVIIVKLFYKRNVSIDNRAELLDSK